jgi:hypothetical protein
MVEDRSEVVLRDRVTPECDPLAHGLEVGGRVRPDRETGRLEERRRDARRRRLAVRAGDVDRRSFAFGVIEDVAQSLDAMEAWRHRLHRVDAQAI